MTVQRRVAYIKGCVSNTRAVPKIEALVKAVPDVERAIALVRTRAWGRPPYKLLSAP